MRRRRGLVRRCRLEVFILMAWVGRYATTIATRLSPFLYDIELDGLVQAIRLKT